MLLLVDSVVISDVLDVAVLEAGLSVISAVGAVLMVVDRDSAVVVDVDWVRVEDMVELVLLIDEVEVDVSVIVGVILLGAVLVESVVDSDMLELEGVLPDVLLLLIDSVVDSDVLELVGEVDEVSVIVED